MNEKYAKLFEIIPGIETDKNLSALSSMGIGGPADLFCEIADTKDAAKLIKAARKLKIPFVIIGGGTNVVFADAGFRGIVIKITAKKITLKNKKMIEAEAGALLSQVVQFAVKHELTGMEKLTGLPGTIGGAVRGNAGAYGTEIKDLFDHALILTEGNILKEVGHNYLDFGYRDSSIKKSKDIILKVWLSLKPNAKAVKKAVEEAKKIIKERMVKQPKGKCSGSFFKNPKKDLSAGYLLDKCGCKGIKVGGAQVSKEHANWILNLGNATQEDILNLSGIMLEKVYGRFGIALEREVQMIGTTGFITE
jgi:UDP-N-acetylmuramate dehydrogenase